MPSRTGSTVIAMTSCVFMLWLSLSACITESRARGGSDLRTMPVMVGTRTIQASVAETVFSRIRGLLDWETIAENQGMLLDFETEGFYAIHMQGMKFPIDAVWIDGQGVVKLIYESIRPNSGLSYPSVFRCRYCLELKAGFCKEYNVAVGQTVKFGSFPPEPGR